MKLRTANQLGDREPGLCRSPSLLVQDVGIPQELAAETKPLAYFSPCFIKCGAHGPVSVKGNRLK
jgi:hypothetical protein